jgi:hypothetical protein
MIIILYDYTHIELFPEEVLARPVFNQIQSLPPLHPASVIIRNFAIASCNAVLYAENKRDILESIHASQVGNNMCIQREREREREGERKRFFWMLTHMSLMIHTTGYIPMHSCMHASKHTQMDVYVCMFLRSIHITHTRARTHTQTCRLRLSC